MKRPGPAVYLLGNPGSVLLILGLGCLLIYQWWVGQIPNGWIALFAVLAMGGALNANQKLADYSQWKRAWDAMGGAAPAKTRRRPRQPGWVQKLVALMIFAAVGFGLTRSDYRQPQHVLAAVCFCLAMVMMAVTLLVRARRARRAARAPSRQDVPVTISIPVPKHSPDTRQLYTGLPDYCARVI